MTQSENSSRNLASTGKYDFIVQGLFSLGSIGLGIFLIIQHRFEFWISKPLGVFCLVFPVLMTVSYIRKQYNFEQERSVFLDKVLGSSPSVIFVYDWQLAQVFVLNGGFPSLGLTSQYISKVQGNLFFDISTEEEFQKIMASLERTVNEETLGVTQTEWNLRAADRSLRTFRVSLTILSKDLTSSLVIGFAEDVTSHKYVEKYAAMQDLGASIAHEISNPLAVISMQTQLLLKKSNSGALEPAYIEESIKKVEKNIDRITRTVKSLKALTKDPTLDSISKFSSNSLMDDIENIWYQRLLNKGIKIDLERASKDLSIQGMRSELTSALFNLISFCFHQLQYKNQSDGKISISTVAAGGHMEFVITDSVPGGDHLHHLFDPTKINELGENIGLSLSFSKSIAQKHGGNLYVDKTSANTRFIFKIPLDQEAKISA